MLKEILLVDDSKGTNALNKRLLQQMGVVEKISTALNGQLALDYLTTKGEAGEYPCPDVIFLDINMPVMDGYQFLEAYGQLDIEMQSGRIIIMLTSSISELDMNKANNYPIVKGYQFKPLTIEKVKEVVGQVLT